MRGNGYTKCFALVLTKNPFDTPYECCFKATKTLNSTKTADFSSPFLIANQNYFKKTPKNCDNFASANNLLYCLGYMGRKLTVNYFA